MALSVFPITFASITARAQEQRHKLTLVLLLRSLMLIALYCFSLWKLCAHFVIAHNCCLCLRCPAVAVVAWQWMAWMQPMGWNEPLLVVTEDSRLGLNCGHRNRALPRFGLPVPVWLRYHLEGLTRHSWSSCLLGNP